MRSKSTPTLPLNTFKIKRLYNCQKCVKKDEKTIRNWITSGRIHAEKVKGSWQIPKSELDSVLVTEQQERERETEREKSDARSSKNLDKQDQTQEDEQETEQEIPAPTDSRSDTRPARHSFSEGGADSPGEVGESTLVQQLKSQIKEHEKLIDEKDLRLAETKAAFERQFTEKDQRLNDKNDRINDLKSDREKDRKLYNDLLTNAQQLIHSLQTQVAQLEAPKQPVRSSVEAVEGDFTEEQGSPSPKNDPLNSDSSNPVPSVQSSPDSGEETKEPETPEQGLSSDLSSEVSTKGEASAKGESGQPKKGLFSRLFSSN